MENINNKLLIITAPSGAGKTSITRFLLQHNPALAFSVSATTRPQRKYEQQGKDYYFISLEEFNQKILQEEFVEWEMVYQGKYYGTLKSELQRIWGNGRHPVLDIDVKGAIHVQSQYPDTTLSLFIEPPSIDALKKRLEARGTESAETLNARISKAAYEISFKFQFSKIIVNDELSRACAEAQKIVDQWLAT